MEGELDVLTLDCFYCGVGRLLWLFWHLSRLDFVSYVSFFGGLLGCEKGLVVSLSSVVCKEMECRFCVLMVSL